MEYTSIIVEQYNDTVVVLSLNRPDQRNALNIEMMKEVAEAIKQIESNKRNRVLIIRGAWSGVLLRLGYARGQIERAQQWNLRRAAPGSRE